MEELVFERQAAAEYDRAFAHVTRYFMPFVLRAARIARGMRVLDIAAGTGLSAAAALSAVGPTGHVTAADVSPAMAVKARAPRRSVQCFRFGRGRLEHDPKVRECRYEWHASPAMRLAVMANSDVDGDAPSDLPARGQRVSERSAGCGVGAAGNQHSPLSPGRHCGGAMTLSAAPRDVDHSPTWPIRAPTSRTALKQLSQILG